MVPVPVPDLPGKVEDFKLGVSDEWVSWTPGTGDAVAQDLAASLGTTPQARELIREAVQVFDHRMPLNEALCLLGALWVPDTSTGEPWAFLLVDLLVSTDPGDPVTAADYLFMSANPPNQRGLKVFDYSAAAATVDAGPAVVQVQVSATKKERDVTSSSVWTVFPPGSHEALRLSFSSPAPAISEAFAAETTAVAHSLTVTLADAP